MKKKNCYAVRMEWVNTMLKIKKKCFNLEAVGRVCRPLEVLVDGGVLHGGRRAVVGRPRAKLFPREGRAGEQVSRAEDCKTVTPLAPVDVLGKPSFDHLRPAK